MCPRGPVEMFPMREELVSELWAKLELPSVSFSSQQNTAPRLQTSSVFLLPQHGCSSSNVALAFLASCTSSHVGS